MMGPTGHSRLRIYVGEDKRHFERPLYQAIVRKAHDVCLAGLTVTRGTQGFGHSTRVHTTEVLFSEDLPVVIEVIDSTLKIHAFSTLLQTIPGVGLMTLEEVSVVPLRPSDVAARSAEIN